VFGAMINEPKKKHSIADFFNNEQSQEQKFGIILPFSGFD
jgi:hypothetical protein